MERHRKHKRSQNQGFGLVVFFIVFLWFYLPSVINWISPSLEKSGQTGDTFGSVNALFSGLALAGIVYTIWYQKKISNQQNFENKFFQLITLHHTIVSGSGEHVINLFQHISRQIKEGYEEERRAFDGHFTIEDLVRLYFRVINIMINDFMNRARLQKKSPSLILVLPVDVGTAPLEYSVQLLRLPNPYYEARNMC
ncbi:hypothetical protein [Paenibacillus luteus]|uniref:hypothetical protein n=1 Tax=Paenibacillus luteus TaxID=2545753 RepID=UPI00114287C0|nr:hypothetical protein [Paenibacillus luteus]